MPRQTLAEILRNPELKALTFDTSGTLVDWDTGLRESFRGLYRDKMPARQLERKVQAAIDRWFEVESKATQEARRGPTRFKPYDQIMRESFDAATRTVRGRGARPNETERFIAGAQRWPDFEDVGEFFREVHQQRPDLKIVLLTNGPRSSAERLLTVIHRTGLQARLLLAETRRSYKPDPVIFNWALRELKLKPQQILHITSSPKFDLDPASRLGFKVLHVRRPTEYRSVTNHPFTNALRLDALVRPGWPVARRPRVRWLLETGAKVVQPLIGRRNPIRVTRSRAK